MGLCTISNGRCKNKGSVSENWSRLIHGLDWILLKYNSSNHTFYPIKNVIKMSTTYLCDFCSWQHNNHDAQFPDRSIGLRKLFYYKGSISRFLHYEQYSFLPPGLVDQLFLSRHIRCQRKICNSFWTFWTFWPWCQKLPKQGMPIAPIPSTNVRRRHLSMMVLLIFPFD